MVEKGTFRSDLFYRINVFVLKIPPLRDRREDVILIARNIAASSLSDPGTNEVVFSREVESLLMQYDWPGNMREVRNVVNFAMHNLLPHESVIEPKHLPPSLFARVEDHYSKPVLLPLKKGVENREIEIIRETLRSTCGNKVMTAKLLGVSRSVLYNKLRKYNLLAYYTGNQNSNA
jgi:transcriptional regulator with PAS, ATPase and Fis domain